MNSLVSVIIPTHNGSEVISRAVDSVLNQTYSEIEVIVVDDNGIGTEEQRKTVNALQKYIDGGLIKYIPHIKNINGSAARNTGVNYSNGKYITLLDDDDVYYPTKVEDGVRCLDKLSDEYAMVYCSIDYDKDNKIRTKIVKRSGNLLIDLLFHDVVIGSDTLMVKSDCYRDIGGFDESFRRHQDFEFTARIAEKWKIHAIEQIGVKSYELGRNQPHDLQKAIEYRRHYIKKMIPIMASLPKLKQRQIISCNFIMLYGKNLRNFKFISVYKSCKENIDELLPEYNFFDFIFSIFHIQFNKLKKWLGLY